jgi:long-subunit fatty acid transport protein
MKKYLYFGLIVIIILPLSASAGSSVFGLGPQLLGEYQYPLSTAAMGRGGVTIAFIDSMGINHFNFALWNTLSRSTISLNMRYQNISSEIKTDEIHSSNANFQGGFLILPIQAKKLSIGFGLIPYSQNDIRVQISQSGQDTSPVQTVSVKGTVSQSQFAIAYKFMKSLSVGLSANYTFGLITDEFDIEYSESGFGDLLIENKYQIYGVGFGMHAFYDISNRLATGLTVKFPSKLTLFTEQISINSEKTIEEDRKLTIPLHFGAGISYKLSSHWKAGFDYHYHAWKNGYRIEDNQVKDMSNSYRIAFGAEREPTSRRFTRYEENIAWRFGIFMGQLNTLANGRTVDEFGLCVGIGLPIIKNRNRFDIAVEFGKRGALNVNDRSDIYFRFNFGLSTNELWFIREER